MRPVPARLPARGFRLWFLLLALVPCLARATPPGLELDLSLDPSSRLLQVRATLDFEGAGSFAWDLAPEFSLGPVTLDGSPVAAAATVGAAGERVYRVALPQRLARHRIEIAYSGTLRALDGGLDHRGVLGGLPAMAGAQGSFLPAGYAWYPRPGDTFRYALAIRTPAGQRAVAAGRLVRETVAAEGNSARFEFEQAAEGIDLMVGPYSVEERSMRLPTGEAVRLRTWFHEPLAGLSAGYLDAAAADRLRHARPDLSRHRGAQAAVHPRHLARPRDPAQLVGQRRVHRRLAR
jgi:aminopeptidase N